MKKLVIMIFVIGCVNVYASSAQQAYDEQAGDIVVFNTTREDVPLTWKFEKMELSAKKDLVVTEQFDKKIVAPAVCRGRVFPLWMSTFVDPEMFSSFWNIKVCFRLQQKWWDYLGVTGGMRTDTVQKSGDRTNFMRFLLISGLLSGEREYKQGHADSQDTFTLWSHTNRLTNVVNMKKEETEQSNVIRPDVLNYGPVTISQKFSENVRLHFYLGKDLEYYSHTTAADGKTKYLLNVYDHPTDPNDVKFDLIPY